MDQDGSRQIKKDQGGSKEITVMGRVWVGFQPDRGGSRWIKKDQGGSRRSL